jgi:hypothetical protein
MYQIFIKLNFFESNFYQFNLYYNLNFYEPIL